MRNSSASSEFDEGRRYGLRLYEVFGQIMWPSNPKDVHDIIEGNVQVDGILSLITKVNHA